MTRLLARGFLRLMRWEPEGRRPAARRYVLIAAPHTSNWDLVYLLAIAKAFDIRVSFMAKHTLFRGPMGWLMRRVGGIPVHRHTPDDGLVAERNHAPFSDLFLVAVPFVDMPEDEGLSVGRHEGYARAVKIDYP